MGSQDVGGRVALEADVALEGSVVGVHGLVRF